jgi:predicted nuclease of predicted toxin-antitoxin system
VTQDSDFYDISIIKKHPPKIIWLRFGNSNTEFIRMKLINLKVEIEAFINDPQLSCFEIL